MYLLVYLLSNKQASVSPALFAHSFPLYFFALLYPSFSGIFCHSKTIQKFFIPSLDLQNPIFFYLVFKNPYNLLWIFIFLHLSLFFKKEKLAALQQVKNYHNKKMQSYPQSHALLHSKKTSYVSSRFGMIIFHSFQIIYPPSKRLAIIAGKQRF